MRPALAPRPGCDEDVRAAAPLTDSTAAEEGAGAVPASSGSGSSPEAHYARVLERVTALAGEGRTAPAITRVLQSEGYTMAPGRSDLISLTTVRRMLREHVRPVRRRAAVAGEAGAGEGGEHLAPDEWWLRDLAVELAMPSITLYGWVRRGWVTVARKESRAPYRLILRADRAEVDRLRARRPPADEQPGAGNGPVGPAR
ncbi:hypothetical protein [Streptomyces sp. NPDC047000]|uniref:hypothetical protein n=1 Tax=Streptomyces sp. NPDC047000 TaxID=3155474 RepID=UPI0033FC0788